ncbi:putative methyltransferase [Geobacter sp. OR-1]|uniref:B12-binding domain-containing radical SAM protein n=1 Tax=Geobacter sp. OR-1 TaxID=1266765 RepID=UPI0005424D83|nr:radical SAM protein [Geobacter sp. OR-1]GAM11544.1 putative methyltransferase [Geobacter sp. OR-1]
MVTIHAIPSPQAVPLAAACLKVFLDSRPEPAYPLNISCSEYYSGTPVNEICAAILTQAPDVVGLPVYVWNRAECCAIAHKLRAAAPDLKIMAGGPEVTADPESVLAAAPFDFLVVGEGELTVSEVMDRLAAGREIDDVAGLARMMDGKLLLSKRAPIADLSILPSPWLAGLLDAHIASGVVWQLSRGCSFGCDFCFDGMGDRKVRRYPMERLEAELDYFVCRGVSQVFVLDSTFNQDVKRAKTLLRLIARKAPQVHCHFEVRHELLDEEQARLFSKLTCSLQIGLQSADPEVAGNVGRKFNRDDFVQKIMFLNEHGAIFGFDLIYGLPGDTLDRFRNGLDFALSLYPNHLDIFPLSVLPGTRVAERAATLGLRHLAAPPYTMQESPTFPLADMTSARRLGSACDIFYSRGKAVAWFNGVLSALRMKPATFLEEFAQWLLAVRDGEPEEAEFSDEAIWGLQRDFLTATFTQRKLKRLLPLALDFAAYHYHYAASVMAVPPEIRQLSGADLKRVPLVRTDSARLAQFNYEILDLLESGEPDLPECYRSLQANGSFAVIYPKAGEVLTESVAEPYFRLLERLDGKSRLPELAANLGIPLDEAIEFLEFAVEEGVVVPQAG